MKWYSTVMLLLCMQTVYIHLAHAQWNSPNRYRSDVFNSAQLQAIANVTYANVYDASKNSIVSLQLNIAGPSRTLDGIGKRPLIVMVHGGGFAPADNGKAYFNGPAAELAKMGYVVATIDYRCYEAWIEPANPLPLFNQSFNDAKNYFRYDKVGGENKLSALPWYTAVQDLTAAVKFLCYNSNFYGIDPNNVFIYGESAGGITALTFATANQGEINELFDLATYVGDLNASTLPACRNQTYTIRAVAAVAAGLPYERFLDPEDRLPLIMEGNKQDPLAPPIIPPGTTPFYYSGISSAWIMNKIKTWSSFYPCSNFYFTQGGTYDVYTGSGYHTLNQNGWFFFKPRTAAFFANILRGISACPSEDFSLPDCHLYSSINANQITHYRTGLTDTEATALSVYPNPATDNITIHGLAETSAVEMTVYDGLGSLVKTHTFQTGENERSTSLSLDGLAAGMYYLRIQDILNDSQFKILKQ